MRTSFGFSHGLPTREVTISGPGGGGGGETLKTRILSRSPFVYYELNESLGATTYLDSSGNNRHLSTVVATTTAGSTQVVTPGTSVDFDGTSGRISSGNNEYGAALQTAFDGNKAYTIITSFNLDSIANSPCVFHAGYWSVNGSQGIAIFAIPDGSVQVSTVLAGGTVSAKSAPGTLLTGNNYIIHGVANGTGNFKAYINGTQVYDGNSGVGHDINMTATSSGQGTRIMVGALNASAAQNFANGRIQHAALIPTAMSAADILGDAEIVGLA